MILYVMVCYGTLWYVMVCYGILWYLMVCYGMLWYVMVCYGMLWYDIVCYGMLWYVMVCYGMLLWYDMVCYGILDKGYRDIWNDHWIVACFNRKSGLSLLDGLLRFWWCVSNEPWRWNIDVGMFQRLGILGKPTVTRTPFWIPRSSSYTIWAKRCLFLKDWLFWMSCSHGFALIILMASSCSFQSLW